MSESAWGFFGHLLGAPWPRGDVLGTPWGPLADFLGTLGGALGRVPERCPEKVRFWRALDLENEALASTGGQFSFLEGSPK